MHNFKRIFNLVRKTGDKLVVANEDGDQALVLMPLDDYERIIDGEKGVQSLSERELWDKVDRDIALWRANHKNDTPDDNLWLEETPFLPEEDNCLAVSEEEVEQLDKDEEPPVMDDLDFKEKIDQEPTSEETADDFNFDDWKDKTVGDALEYIEKQKADELNKTEQQTEIQERNLRRSRFAIPKERRSGLQDKALEKNSSPKKNISEPIKYEDIPPPPDVSLNDLMVENEPVIDASLEDNFDDDQEIFGE